MVVHYKKVTMKDRMYNNWRNRPGNIWARRLMNVSAVLGSWKSYKLAYSSFWGVKLTPARFTKPTDFRLLQKRFLIISLCAVNLLMVGICIFGLMDMFWGTQLYIQMIENILIFGVLAWAGLWEQKMQEKDYLAEFRYHSLSKGANGKINAMSALDNADLA